MVGRLTRIGLLGGTFDPPHKGHLALAEAAQATLGLAEVWFLPAGQPVHKEHPITPAEQRLAMTELLIEGQPTYRVDDTDLRRPPPHYSLTLLPILQARRPDAEFWLIIGGDSLRDLDTWHRPDEILKLVKLAVLPRPGVMIDWLALCRRFPTLPERMRWLDGALVDAASSTIRHNGLDAADRADLTPQLLAYIRAHHLYGE